MAFLSNFGGMRYWPVGKGDDVDGVDVGAVGEGGCCMALISCKAS